MRSLFISLVILLGISSIAISQTFNIVPTQPANSNNNAAASTAYADRAANTKLFYSGSITAGDCLQAGAVLNSVVDSGAAGCGGGGGGGFNPGYVNIKSFGAVGNGSCTALSAIYGNLAAAQAVYPSVSDLTQCVDWAAAQKAINTAYAVGPTSNNSSTIFCPSGQYTLSNPLFVDQANNTQGSYPAWAVGTNYANGANVTYNGIPWLSMGSGNLGNPPTSSNNFPSQLQMDTNDTFSIKTVSITNATPAVFTLTAGNANLVNNMPIVLSPQTFAVPPSGATPALPTGLSTNVVYYIKAISGNTFQVSTTAGGASVNTTSAGTGVFFINSQVWQVAPVVSSSNFSNRVAFIGAEAAQFYAGCTFTATSMWQNATVYLGPQNSNIVRDITLTHANGGGSTPPYRCNRFRMPVTTPFGNFFTSHVGWQQMDNGGGSSFSEFERVGASGYFTNFAVGYVNGQLGDSNTFIKSSFSNSCIGIEWMETQTFINTLIDNIVFDTSTGLKADLNEGAKVIGGNYSTFQGIANSFTISSVSVVNAVNPGILQATISSPDQYLLAPMCAMNAGYAFSQSPHYGNTIPLGNSCGYNVFTIVTAQYGVIPFYIGAFNPYTNVITLVMIPAYANAYAGTFGLASALTSATTLYAAEMGNVFFGQIQVDSLHIESPIMPMTILCNCGGFGAARTASMTNVFLNSPLSLGTTVCCGLAPSNAQKAQFYAQQTVPAIIAWEGDIIIDSLTGGADFNSNPNANDRALIGANSGVYIEGRHTSNSAPGSDTGQTPSFDFQMDAQNLFSPVAGFANTQLSGGYWAFNGGAYGGGKWDTPQFFLPASKGSKDITGTNQLLVDTASTWRAYQWGLSDSWGLRPAPYEQACITPAQANTLAGSIPAITHQSILVFQSFLNVTAGGSGYNVNDTITLAGGTFSTAAVGTVRSVSGGAVTSFQISNVLGVYSVEPTSFTQSSSSGGGTGATFNLPTWYVHYTIGYPILWGGQLYRMCDFKGPAVGSVGSVNLKHTIESDHTGYSYFQNLTTTNVPNLSWTMAPQSPFVYMNQEALELMFPGLNIQLTPDNTNGCGNTAESFQVLEVHPTLGYVKVINAGQDGTPFLPQFPGAGPCKNTTIGQQSINIFAPF